MSNVGKRGKVSLLVKIRDAALKGTGSRLTPAEVLIVQAALIAARKEAP